MMTLLANQWRYFLIAIMFFTRIPIHFNHLDDNELNKSSRFFPLVGTLVGMVGACVYWLSDIVLPFEIAVLLSMLSTIWLTGAFHEDGLADAADGLGGGYHKEQVLTIMTDSRIGSYGAVSLILVLTLKYQALSYQSAAFLPATIVAGHALSRLCSVLVMFTQQYVKAEGKSKPLATQLSTHELMIATFCGLLPLAFLEVRFLASLVPVALIWAWFSLKIKKRIGGYTGDCLGAMQQITEVTFYVGLLASAELYAKLSH